MAVTIPASGYMENSSRNKGEMKTSLEQLRDAISTIDGEVDQNISDISILQSQVSALSGIASATETSEGIIELANISETQTGTDATRAVTPAGLSSRTATETRTGLAELATNTEVQTGTDTSRIVTPAGLSSRIATETRTGIIELATNVEALIGTDTSRAITPASLNSVVGLNSWVSITPLNGWVLDVFPLRYKLIYGERAIQITGGIDGSSATSNVIANLGFACDFNGLYFPVVAFSSTPNAAFAYFSIDGSLGVYDRTVAIGTGLFYFNTTIFLDY